MQLDRRPNNFDFIRVLAAGIVLVGHQFALTFRPEPQPLPYITAGTLGVLIFFSVSGYLVAQSWDRDPHLWRFAVKRALRSIDNEAPVGHQGVATCRLSWKRIPR